MIRALLVRWLGLAELQKQLDFMQRQLDAQALVVARADAEMASRRDAEINDLLREVIL